MLATDVGLYGLSAKGLRYNLENTLAMAMRNGGRVAPILSIIAKTHTVPPINAQRKGGPQIIQTPGSNDFSRGGKPVLAFSHSMPEFGAGGVKNYICEWDDYNKPPDETTTSGTFATTATSLSINNGATLNIQNSSSGRRCFLQLNGLEIVEVTAGAGTDTLTVTRAQLGSVDPGTTYAVGTRAVTRFNHGDGNDWVAGLQSASARVTNNTQVLRRDYALGGSTQSYDTTGNLGSMGFQRKMKAHEIMNQLAHDAIYGLRYDNGLLGASRIANMGGARFYGTTVSSLTLNKANLRTQLDLYATNGGNLSECIALCGINVYAKVCDLKDLYVLSGGQDMEKESLNFDIKTLKFFDFQIPFATDNTLNPDDMLIINPKYIDLVMVKGRELMAIPLAKTGDTDKEMMLTEASLKVRLGAVNIRYYPSVA